MSQPDQVVGLVREVFGPGLAGAYLHGSAVLGGLRPGSDLDIFTVVRDRTTGQQRRALVAGLLEISGVAVDPTSRRGPARPIELIVVAQPEVRPWRYPPRREFLYGEWLRDGFERGGTPSPEPDPDLAPLITMVLRGDTPLYGPPPRELLDPVPAADLARAIVAGVPGLLADLESDTRNVILTLARIWTTLATGEIRSKDQAADWALPRLPPQHRPVLARARDIYLGTEPERWDGLLPQVQAHVAYVVDVIERDPST